MGTIRSRRRKKANRRAATKPEAKNLFVQVLLGGGHKPRATVKIEIVI